MGKETVTIERMKKEDLDQVLVIEQDSFSQPWSRNLFLSEFRSVAVSTLLVACIGAPSVRRIAGYIIYWNIEDEMHILNLAVGPAYRKHGIGKQLILSAIIRAYKKGARKAFLEVRVSNSDAQRIYSSLGFTGSFVRRNYYDAPAEDAIVMTMEPGMFQSLAKNEL